MKTKGALLYGVGEKWQVEEIEVGEPLPGEVMVKMAASGLCHSDDHLLTGDIPVPHYPILGGHEGSGVVIKVGPGVTRVEEGDHVIVSLAACGACEPCRTGHQNVCDLSKNFVTGQAIADGNFRVTNKDGEGVAVFCLEGTFSPYATVSEFSVVKIDDDMPLEPAALIGCCVTAGWGAAMRTAGVQNGDVVVVAGFGGLGASAVLGSLACGASQVVVIDPLPNKRELALEFGASHAFSSLEEAFGPLAHMTNGAMAHKVILTIGRMQGSYIEPARKLVRKLGTLAVIGLGSLGDEDVKLNLQTLTSMSQNIRGGQMGGGSPQEDAQMYVRLYKAGKLPLERLITRTYKLEDINEGYQDMRDGKNIRGLVVYGDDDH
jgi:NDMA-dependent alcohol dehydrogenase